MHVVQQHMRHVAHDKKAEPLPKWSRHRPTHAISGYGDVTVTPIEGTDEKLLMLPPGYSYPRNPEAYFDHNR